ncbi:penicillin-binding protein activator [Bdellovibrio sp. HCB337]|uniref:penicillin-binding protein activator n=1 Tax=Bdellovibrio sp. HCB337 TaxID=3394358 RepID=UPI0039A639AA
MRNGFLILAALTLAACSVSTKRPELEKYPQKGGRQPIITPVPVGQSGKQVGGMGQPLPPAGKANVQRVRDLEAAGDYMQALKESVNFSVSATTPQEQESFRLKSVEIVEGKLNQEQLEKVARDSDFGFSRGYALFRLGEISLEDRDKDRARKYFSSVSEFLPGSDLAVRAQDILSQLESSKFVESKTIGVVLPLTGKNAAIGQKALRGVELGLGLNNPGSGFRLAVMDSEGNPDGARRGVERLVKEDNAIAIVGSLLSKTAPAVAAKADELGVPTIGLSQKSGLTEIGPTVFRNALTSEMQVRYLVRTAMEDYGMKRFAIVYPNDPYGVEYTNLFWDEVLARGGTIASVQTYHPKETDFRYAIQRLVGTYYIEGRVDEYKARIKQAAEVEKKKSARVSHEEEVLPPIVDFDAVFIPDSAKAMGQIAAFLSFSGVKNVKLMGTNLWNTPGLAKRAGNFANSLIFVDSFLPQTAAHSRFVQEYKGLYNEEPSLIEIQAYDSALILRQLVAQGAATRESLTRELTSLKKFPGALGVLNMSPDREIQRPLMALTLDKGEITPLKIQK